MMQRLIPVLAIAGGTICCAIGAFYTIGLLTTLHVSTERLVVDFLGIVLLGLLPLSLGSASIWYGRQRLKHSKRTQQQQHDTTLRRQILQLAQRHPQGITRQECLTHVTGSEEEVDALLNHLYLEDTLDMDVSEQGELIYKLKRQ